MTQLELPGDGDQRNPFDAIKRTRPDGSEYWTARDMVEPLGYGADWRNFSDTVDRARAACRNSKHDPQDHFGDATKMVPIGSGAQRSIPDVELTRYGAYLVAMNGDPRKRQVAEAQTYFAVKTREAEIAAKDTNHPAIPQSFAEALRLAADQQEQIEAQRAQIEADAPKVAYVDNFLRSDDACLVRKLAKRIDMTERELRDELMRRQVIFRRPIENRFSESKQKWVTEYQYEANTKYRGWFVEGDQPNAPRHNNGQLRTTLYITPAGKVGIARLLGRLDSTPLQLEGASA